VEEFGDDGHLVVRPEMPGIDPDEDVEITVTDHMLHLSARRRSETKTEGLPVRVPLRIASDERYRAIRSLVTAGYRVIGLRPLQGRPTLGAMFDLATEDGCAKC
jgi:hypothetical protein